MTRNSIFNYLVEFESENIFTSWFELLITLIIFVSLVAANTFISYFPLKLLISGLQGLAMVRLFVIYHDYNHGTILKNSILAAIVMNLFGLLILAPATIWNYYHNYHHRNNTKISGFICGSFPILSKDEYHKLNSKEKRSYRFVRSGHIILFSYLYIFLVSFCLNPFLKNPKQNWMGILAIGLHVTLSIFLFAISWSTLIFFLSFPLFIMTLIAGYIFYVQHNSPDIRIYENNEWDFIKAAINSSTFIKMNLFWRWITANIGHHHIHHLNSKIPFYKLHKVLINNPGLRPTVTSTLSPRDIKKCLKLKLWDDKSGRLVAY